MRSGGGKGADAGQAEAQLDEAMELIHFGFRRVVELPDRELAKRGFGRLHHRILYVVGHNPGATVGQVVDLLGVTKQAVHQPLRDLLDGGFVETRRGAEDRRTKNLHLTERGLAFERELAHMQHEVFARAFDQAGPEAEAGWRAVMDLIGGGSRLRVR